MIAEKFPELEAFPPDEQLKLAAELAKKTAPRGGIPELTARSVEVLEERLDYYLANSGTGINWEDLRGLRVEG